MTNQLSGRSVYCSVFSPGGGGGILKHFLGRFSKGGEGEREGKKGEEKKGRGREKGKKEKRKKGKKEKREKGKGREKGKDE